MMRINYWMKSQEAWQHTGSDNKVVFFVFCVFLVFKVFHREPYEPPWRSNWTLFGSNCFSRGVLASIATCDFPCRVQTPCSPPPPPPSGSTQLYYLIKQMMRINYWMKSQEAWQHTGSGTETPLLVGYQGYQLIP